MSEENFMNVRRIGHAVRDGLGPYVLAEYKFEYTRQQYLGVLQETLNRAHAFTSHDEPLKKLDLQAWLNAMEFKWNDVFKRKLGHTAREAEVDPNVGRARSYVNELRRTRNLFSHEAPKDEFTDEDVYRIADTATRLLAALKGKDAKQARKEATKSEEIRREYGEKLYLSENASTEAIDLAPQSTPNAEPIVQIVREPYRLVDLRGARLRKMDLRNRELRFAILSSAKLEKSNLREEDLSEVRLDYAVLKGTDLSKATLVGADLSKANLEDAKLPNAVLQRAKLHHANLRNVNLEFADMRHADLTEADMDSANLRNANLSYANLSATNLVGTDFSGAILQGANLNGAKLRWEGHDFLRKSPTEAVFDRTSILPDGQDWRHSTNMNKFTGSLKDC